MAAPLTLLHTDGAPPCASPVSTLPAFGSDGFYQLLVETSQLAFFDYDVLSDTLQFSVSLPGGKRRVKRRPRFLATLETHSAIPEQLRLPLSQAAERLLKEPCKKSLTLCMDLFHTGEYRRYLLFMSSLLGAGNTVERVIGHMRDIQAEKQTELRLQNLSVYRRAIDYASLFVYEFDLPHFSPRPASAPPKQDDAFYPLSDYLCPRCTHLIHPDDLCLFTSLFSEDFLLEAYHAQRFKLEHSFRILNRHSQWIWVCMTIHLSYGTHGREAHGIGYMKVIQDRVAPEERAKLDSVTGLLNRGATKEQIGCTLASCCPQAHFFIFDVDNFKAVNDTQGHAAGDELLRVLSHTLRAHLRHSDLLGRIGGDEFVALLCGLSDEDAATKAQELLHAVTNMKRPAGWQGDRPLSVSIGIARAPECGRSFNALYQRADRALYGAKRAGKNRFLMA